MGDAGVRGRRRRRGTGAVTAADSRNKRDAIELAARYAAEAFTTRPWRDINMTDIARQAKCSLSTLYNAFGGKEQFILYAVSHVLQTDLPDLGARDRDNRQPEALIWLNLYAHARFLCAEPIRQAFANMASLPSDSLDARRQFHMRVNRFRGHMADLVRAGQDAGTIRDVDAAAAAINLIARSGWQLGLWPLVLGDLAETPDLEAITDEALAPYLTETGAARMAQWRQNRP